MSTRTNQIIDSVACYREENNIAHDKVIQVTLDSNWMLYVDLSALSQHYIVVFWAGLED